MKKQNGITLIALVISIIVMLILAGVSINAVVGDNGVIGKAQETLYLQSCAVLEEFLQMEASNYALEENPYKTQYGMLRAKHPGWFYQNAQGYILDSDGHVMYLIKKSGLPQEIQDQITGGDANKVSQYYKQIDVYGVTSDLQVYYCNNGTDTILGLTIEDLEKDDPLEIAYDEESLLSKVINGTNEEGKANEALSTQDLKSIKTLTIDTTEKLALLNEFIKLSSLQTVYFKNITIQNLNGIQNAPTITEIRFTSCSVSDYSAMCALTKLNKLYLIKPAGKNTDVEILCSTDKGIATAEFSNLQYFGIVGNAEWIQSTSTNYKSDRYAVTDVSGLANLSLVTKEAIQYMYLQNLQLTSIASLADYINVIVLRVEYNALETFDGIQKMSNLTYLFAPYLYSNATSTYTLGMNETDTQNASTDALSYIYKDEEGKNTKLYVLDIRDSKNLKWTSYLSTCSALRFLYMTDNTAIKDISTIANIIGNCGSNYSVPSNFTTSIISNNSVKLDLKGNTITESDFRILKNNTKLVYLSLWDTVITADNGTTFSDVEYTSLVNEVLSTCTKIEYLTLFGQSKLTNIDFVNNLNRLKELDLYGCTQVNDISILETKTNSNATTGFKLSVLNLSNTNLDLTTIQNTISNLGDTKAYWYRDDEGVSRCYGLGVSNLTLAKKLEECTEITNLIMRRGLGGNNGYFINFSGTVDLTNCTKLTTLTLYNNRISYKLPSSLKNFNTGWVSSSICDLSQCSSLENINVSDTIQPEVLDGIMNSIPSDITTLKTILLRLKYYTYPNFDWCSRLVNSQNLTSFNITEVNNDNTFGLPDITGIKNLKNLTSLTIQLGSANTCNLVIPDLSELTKLRTFYVSYGTVKDISPIANCTSLTNLSIIGEPIKNVNELSNLTNLVSLNLSNNQLTDVSALSSLTNLTSLTLTNNNLNDIKPLENLKKLETLNLQNNALYDSTYDSTGKAYYTLTIFSDLNQNQDGKLKNLYLSGNSIEDFSMLQDSNLKWDAKSGW